MQAALADFPRRWSDTSVRWSYTVRDGDGEVVASHEGDRLQSTASVGKLLLLVTAARQVAQGVLDLDAPRPRTSTPRVSDSGLLQHLDVPSLSVRDLAVLVAAVSDNWATNVLLDTIGIDAVEGERSRLGLVSTRLLDRVRDVRGPDDPPRLSEGTTDELSWLMSTFAGTRGSDRADELVRHWLTLNTDLSMVGSSLGLDPLAHTSPEAGLVWLRNKTGCDVDVRADVGIISSGAARLAYAVVANGEEVGRAERLRVMDDMRDFGKALADAAQNAGRIG